MKKLTTLLFSILISFNSFGEWTEVTKTSLGEFDVKFYIDKETIRKNGDHVYYWELGNSLKPVEGTLSIKVYNKADCVEKRVRVLSIIFYKKPMGKDKISENSKDNPEWEYAHPGSPREDLINYACNYVK